MWSTKLCVCRNYCCAVFCFVRFRSQNIDVAYSYVTTARAGSSHTVESKLKVLDPCVAHSTTSPELTAREYPCGLFLVQQGE